MTDRDVTRVSRINYSPARSRVCYVVRRSHRWERTPRPPAYFWREKKEREGVKERQYLYIRLISQTGYIRVLIGFNLKRASKTEPMIVPRTRNGWFSRGPTIGTIQKRTGPRPAESGRRCYLVRWEASADMYTMP